MRTAKRSVVVAGLTGWLASGGPCAGQAPSVSQIWDVRFVTDCREAPAIGVTVQARVAIVPNPAGVANFGVLRCGGAEGSLLITLTDPNGSTPSQGVIVPGLTGETLAGGAVRVDTAGQPLRGTFSPFRGLMAPAGSGGANGDPYNGLARVGNDGRPTLTSLVNSRIGLWDGVARGAALPNGSGELVGAFAEVYRFVYVPPVRSGRDYEPSVTVSVQNLGARYIYAVSGTVPVGAAVYPLADRTVSFDTVIGPVVWREPVGGAVCAGGSVTLAPRIVGLRPMTFQWFKDGEVMAGANEETLTLLNFGTGQVGSYHLEAMSACGSAATEAVEVRMSTVTPPVIHGQPGATSACVERALVVSAGVTAGSGGGVETYQWLRGATGAAVTAMTPVAGANGPTLTIPSAAVTDAGDYRLRIVWACGTVVSEAAAVTINTRVPEIRRQPVGSTVQAGGTARVSAEVTERDLPAGEAAGLTLRWHKDMAPVYDSARISGAGTAAVEIREVRESDAGQYQLLIVNGCVSGMVSSYAGLVVTPAPPPPPPPPPPPVIVIVSPTGRGVVSGESGPAVPGDGGGGGGDECVADFNASGIVDGDDLADAIACFSTVGCTAMDIDGDGDVDPDDLTDFLGAYFGAC